MTANAESQAEKGDVDSLLDDFLQDADLQGLTSESQRTYQSNLVNAFEYLDTDPLTVDRHDLKALLTHLKNERPAQDGTLGLTQSSIENYFSSLSSFFKFLKYEGYIKENPVPEFRERYLENGRESSGSERQLISIEEMAMLVHATLNVRNRAVIVVLAKTGVRRNELIQMDLAHIDWEEQSIRLRTTAKRTNTLVFFDGECARVLRRWLRAREESEPSTDALFINQYGERLKRNGIYEAVTKPAETVELHDPNSTDLQDRFTPHCCRHWFTTHLRRSGMKREFIKELRGDKRSDAIDIYDHIDREELREAYLAHIPSLGI